jgi:hypothetical protein
MTTPTGRQRYSRNFLPTSPTFSGRSKRVSMPFTKRTFIAKHASRLRRRTLSGDIPTTDVPEDTLAGSPDTQTIFPPGENDLVNVAADGDIPQPDDKGVPDGGNGEDELVNSGESGHLSLRTA